MDAGGLSFKAPESWKSIPTTSPMRRAQLKVEPVPGDDYLALLVVYAFPGGAGSVEANLTRWQGQFKDADGNPPEIEARPSRARIRGHPRRDGGPLQTRADPGMAPEPERRTPACWSPSSRPTRSATT